MEDLILIFGTLGISLLVSLSIGAFAAAMNTRGRATS